MHRGQQQDGAGRVVIHRMARAVIAGCALWAVSLAALADRYVVRPGTPGGTNAGPFDDWTRAATQIQWAVDAAGDTGDTVWVSNGVYVLTNQIVVTNAVTLRSAEGHGPEDILIDGGFTDIGAEGETTNRRCLWMSNAAALVYGFTFSNGASLLVTNKYDYSGSGAGVWMRAGVLSNCVVRDSALFSPLYSYGGGGGIYCDGTASQGATVTACRVFGNILTNLVFQAGNVRGAGFGLYLAGNTFVSDCVISNNRIAGSAGTENRGAGVYASGSGCQVRSCLICSNLTGSAYGGGIHMSSSASLHDSTVTVNSAGSAGGCFISAGGTISNCVISSNRTTGGQTTWAGGIQASDSLVSHKTAIHNTRIEGNTIIGVSFGNSTGPNGAGPGLKEVVNCTIIGHVAQGLRLGGTNNWISNCVVSGNGGLGVDCYNGFLRSCLISGNASNGLLIRDVCQTALVSACTIVDNQAANGGAGVRVEATAPGLVQLSSCIVAGNGASGTNDVYDATGNNAGALQYSCAGDLAGFIGASNLVADPQFKDASGGDYRLRYSSPCINAGLNEPWMDTAVDLAGAPRILHDTVDMGAYEVLKIMGGVISVR